MTIACPQCAAPVAFSAEPLASSGRMMRCARCGTSWLGRLHVEDPYGGRRPAPMLRHGRPRFEQIIEHVDPDFGAPRKTFGRAGDAGTDLRARAAEAHVKIVSRRGLAAWSGVGAAVILAALFAATLFDSTGVDAAPESGSGKFAGLEVRLLDGGLTVLRDGHSVAVRGEITNRSDRALDVPAVRVTLKADGTQLYSWTVEPSTMRLGAGDSVRFRSALAASPAGIDEVAFGLADRREITVGMR